MRVYSFCNIEYDDALAKLSIIEENALAIVNFNIGGRIDLYAELGNKEGKIRRFAEISKDKQINLFVGFYVILGDKNYLSVLVINKGKLLGMSDMTHYVSDMYNVGNTYKAYDLGDAVVGVVTGDDMYFPETYRALCFNNAEFIIAISTKRLRDIDHDVVSANAYMNGTSVFAQFADGVCYAMESEKAGTIVKNEEFYLDTKITVNNRFLTAVKDNYDKVELL